MKRTNNQGFIFKGKNTKINLTNTTVKENRIEATNQEQTENNQGYIFKDEVEELEAEGATVEKNIITEVFAKANNSQEKNKEKELFRETEDMQIDEEIIDSEEDLQQQIENKKTEFEKLTASAKDKLESKSKYSTAKHRERDEKLEEFFKNFPASHEEFIKGLENVKLGLSRKLTRQEINNLCQAKSELIEYETKLKQRQENKSLFEQLIESQNENKKLVNLYNNFWEEVINKSEVQQPQILQPAYGIPGPSKK